MKNFFLILFAFSQIIYAQTVITYDEPATDLDSRWDWAFAEAKNSGFSNYWIVYTFEKLMPENNTIGHFYRNEEAGKKLGEILYPERPIDYIESLKGYSKSRSSKKINKEIALMWEIKNGNIVEVDMSTIDLHFRLKGLPLFWLGIGTEQQSIKKIIDAYTDVTSNDAKENLIAAAGMHKSNAAGYNFLKDVVENDTDNERREEAVFWIGHMENSDVVPYLREVALTAENEDVAEKAVFSLHNINSEASLDAVIFLTKKATGDVREKAIFWLGQLAGKKAVESLEEIVFSDDETDIQKQAVFALSQLDDGQGIPKLIKTANTHPNPKIRKNAIFWLGESEDERALKALIELVKK